MMIPVIQAPGSGDLFFGQYEVNGIAVTHCPVVGHPFIRKLFQDTFSGCQVFFEYAEQIGRIPGNIGLVITLLKIEFIVLQGILNQDGISATCVASRPRLMLFG